LTLIDDSHDSEQVTVAVDGEPRVLTVSGGRAQTVLVGVAPGTHSVLLTEPAGCFPEVIAVCPLD
jgi:hypothetical protein